MHAGTDAALFAEIQSAYERKAPILAWVYKPHWATVKFDGEWVDFPRYTPECYSDASWGMNKDMAYDCGKPRGWIKKVGWKGGEAKWPGAYKAIRNFKIDNAHVVGEFGDVIGRRIDHQVFWRADLDDRAVLHDRNAVGEPDRLVEVVSDEHDGLVQHRLQAQELVLHAACQGADRRFGDDRLR